MAAGLKSLHIFPPRRGKKARAFRNPEASEFRDSEVEYFIPVLFCAVLSIFASADRHLNDVLQVSNVLRQL
ncbi:hypothetical protein [Rhizobium sp. H4]|uniref:hypothetical protein n=1 Tax=Rhizobium sp. H4 TaxID=2035449 RepID=UPI001141B84C|nr:hypothetical protein [Rhizobium sp. H4]